MFLPALAGGDAPLSPARAYLLSLNSPRNRQTMASFLNIVAGMLGSVSLDACNWGSLRRHHVMAVTELLRDTGRAMATVNTYLSALKGLAKEAWMLRLMNVESFQHIRAVRNLRGRDLAAAQDLDRGGAWGKEGPLFTRIRCFDTLTNDRLTDQAVYHVLQVRQQQAGKAKCTPHDLRRTFATAMLDNGEDLITVKDAMGHASVTTTQQYDRRGEARLRTARDRLDLV